MVLRLRAVPSDAAVERSWIVAEGGQRASLFGSDPLSLAPTVSAAHRTALADSRQ